MSQSYPYPHLPMPIYSAGQYYALTHYYGYLYAVSSDRHLTGPSGACRNLPSNASISLEIVSGTLVPILIYEELL
jgi:hypothetical protein